MKNNKVILRFLIFFSIVYTILLFPQTGVNKMYNKLYYKIGNTMFGNIGDEAVIHLKEDISKKFDTKIYLTKKSLLNKNNVYDAKVSLYNIRRGGYIPTVFFLALLIATPLSWKRKTMALLSGIALVMSFAMMKLYIMILHCYVDTPYLGLYQLPGEKKSIEFWADVFARPNTQFYYFVILVWVAVSFGKKDFQKLTGDFVKLSSKQPHKQVKNNQSSTKRK